jgi:hypothetical protein
VATWSRSRQSAAVCSFVSEKGLRKKKSRRLPPKDDGVNDEMVQLPANKPCNMISVLALALALLPTHDDVALPSPPPPLTRLPHTAGNKLLLLLLLLLFVSFSHP